jgi:hypothetical protein
VYFATAASANRGATWAAMASVKLGTNPNDGYVLVDPNAASTRFFRFCARAYGAEHAAQMWCT